MAAAKFGAVVRQFSASAARSQLVKAPVQVFGVEGRYAHALYSAASKEKKLDIVEKELNGFKDLIGKDARLSEYIYDPTVKRLEKKDVLQKVLTDSKVSNITTNLFTAMAENGRISKTDAVIKAFATIMGAHRGEVACTVTTAKALDAANMKQLEAALQTFIKKGQTLQITTEVDPSILGGMVVNLGDKYVDMSTATKIRNYTNLIKEPV